MHFVHGDEIDVEGRHAYVLAGDTAFPAALKHVYKNGTKNILDIGGNTGKWAIASAKYADFQRFIQPYLDHFGVSYAVLDIRTNAAITNFERYAVVIVGHGQIDSNNLYLGTVSQANLSAAVATGTGLVNFDSDLSAAGIARFQKRGEGRGEPGSLSKS